MMRLFGLAFTALVFAGTTAVAEEKTTAYYPLKIGTKWTYKVSGGSIEVKVDKKEKVNDEETYRLETSSQGKVSAWENVVVREDGVYRVAVNGLKPESPIKFLALTKDQNGALVPEKAAGKNSWEVKTKVSGQDVDGTFKIKEEDVTVPFGTYKGSFLVEGNNFKIAGQDTTIKCWFAKDLGIVKLEFKLGGQDATLELEKYEPGK